MRPLLSWRLELDHLGFLHLQGVFLMPRIFMSSSIGLGFVLGESLVCEHFTGVNKKRKVSHKKFLDWLESVA